MGNTLVPYALALFGLRNSFLMSTCFYACATLLFIFGNSLTVYAIALLIAGANDTFMMICIKTLMKEAFGKSHTTQLSICFSGVAACLLIWPLIAAFVINPQGLKPSLEYFEEGKSVLYFGREVLGGLQTFMVLQLCLQFVVTASLTLIYFGRKFSKGDFTEIIHEIVGGRLSRASVIMQHGKLMQEQKQDEADLERLEHLTHNPHLKENENEILSSKSQNLQLEKEKNEAQIIELKARHHRTADFQANKTGTDHLVSPLIDSSDNKNQIKDILEGDNMRKSFIDVKNNSDGGVGPVENSTLNEELIAQKSVVVKRMNENTSRHKKDIWHSMKQRKFIELFALCVVRTLLLRYFHGNFKIIGLFFLRNDILVNTVSAFCNLAFLIMSLVFGLLYSWLGLRSLFKFIFFINAVSHISYALYPDSPSNFLVFSALQRVN